MFDQLKDYFLPSKRSAFRRIFGFGAFASVFGLWALCGHDLSIAALSLPWLCISLYYVVIWWVKSSLDRVRLTQAYSEPSRNLPAPQPRRGNLRVPPGLK